GYHTIRLAPISPGQDHPIYPIDPVTMLLHVLFLIPDSRAASHGRAGSSDEISSHTEDYSVKARTERPSLLTK
ncbi:MAG: hypothetical protein ACRDIB_04335, partial [Ardenticatenaceae bacterium]